MNEPKPTILIIDDILGRDDGERLVFLGHTGLHLGQGEGVPPADGIGSAFFCSGQRESSDRLENDTELIKRVVRAGPLGTGVANWALVLLDVRFTSGARDASGNPKGEDGDELFGEVVREELLAVFPSLPVTLLTSSHQNELQYQDVPYLSKEGVGVKDVRRVLLRHGRLTAVQKRALLGLMPSEIAESEEMLEVFRQAYLYAVQRDLSVLLVGKSGVGKEMVARYIHRISGRGGPFVGVNVGGLPTNLVESEMFGYERGAFTGANTRKVGFFERAEGGTLLLDEIGEMPEPDQVRLLRALQERVFLRVGGVAEVPFDVRVVAATGRDVRMLVGNTHMRVDLFHRLAGKIIEIPELSRRQADIVPLAELRLRSKASEKNLVLGDDAKEVLEQHSFPGNVRELENLLDRLHAVAGRNEVISGDDVRRAIGRRLGAASPEVPKPPQEDTARSLSDLEDAIAHLRILPSDLTPGVLERMERHFAIVRRMLLGVALAVSKMPEGTFKKRDAGGYGNFNVQRAARLLTGKPVSNKEPQRLVNRILDRGTDEELTMELLEKLARESQDDGAVSP